ncbi:transcription repressor OFP6-like [Impatiens glandulifera]|uniref:transcription repressor OFP6-like n=1 Tax=Impatiens glandulifera TaxID=253017 RepID=UPI001FB04BC1|nr:transcription repressor OFP6-like [Impatiens glandulifera]
MENNIHRKISRLFPIPCRLTAVSDVIQHSIVAAGVKTRSQPKRSSSSSVPIIKEPTKTLMPEDSKDKTQFILSSDSSCRCRRSRRNSETCHEKPSSSSSAAAAARRRKVEESYVVAKTSRDPYRDFRESMVEMIVEKKIKGAEDLEKLLESFLGLNDSYYHQVILHAFSDICEALFSLS